MSEDRPTAAFILSLIAGILITLGGLLMVFIMGFGMSLMGGMMNRMMSGNMSRMMSGMMGSNFPLSLMTSIGVTIGVLGVTSGAIVLLSTFMLQSRPHQHATWGAIIIAFSVLSIIGGFGGFLVGLILGVIGGALAIAWSPSRTP